MIYSHDKNVLLEDVPEEDKAVFGNKFNNIEKYAAIVRAEKIF